MICRFVSILGERYTHGHVYDFFRALRSDPTRLTVLGDGKQTKSYLYVQDCVSAMLRAVEQHADDMGAAHVYNLGTEEAVTVDESVAVITGHLGVTPLIVHTGGTRGWVGGQPAHPAGYDPDPVARLATRGHHPRGHRSDPRLADRRQGGGFRVSVIFARAPLRISLGGGGTDLPSYYREQEGFLVRARSTSTSTCWCTPSSRSGTV